MKKILILITVLITFINAEINEHKTDLFFANGIANQRTDAMGAWNSTFLKLLKKYPEIKWNIQDYVVDCNEVLKTCVKIKIDETPHLAYNQTINHISDVLEALIQKLDLGEIKRTEIESFFNNLPYELVQEYHEEFLNNLNDVNGTLELTDKERKIIKDDLIFGSELEEMEQVMNIIENHDLTNQIAGYKAAIENGHKVVVLSHSQGNLFTEKVFSSFRDTNGSEWYLKYFEAYGVASPANSVLGNTFIEEEQQYSQDFYLTSTYDAIKYVPSNLNPNTTIDEYEKGYSILEGLVKGHLMTTYLNEKYLSNIILKNLKNRIETRNKTQWDKEDNNISNCEIQTFVNRYTWETIETVNYSENDTSGYLISNANGINVNSKNKGSNSIEIVNSNQKESIPEAKPEDFCHYLEFAHEFIGGDINDTRPIILKEYQEETYFEHLTVSFNKIDKVDDYTFSYIDTEGNIHNEDFKVTQADLFIEDNNHRARHSKIFNTLGEYSDIQILRKDTNESSNAINFNSTSSKINDSLELEETKDGNLIISWDQEKTVEEVNIVIKNQNNDTSQHISKVPLTGEYLMDTFEAREMTITLIKNNRMLETPVAVTKDISLNKISISPLIKDAPGGSFYEDKYYQEEDYVSYYWQTDAIRYTNISKVDIIINDEIVKTLDKPEHFNNGYDTLVDRNNVGKGKLALIVVKGCNKYNECVAKMKFVDTSGRDLIPKVRNEPTKSVYKTYASVPASTSAYENAFYVDIFLNGGYYTTLSLDRLQSNGASELVYVDSETDWTVSSMACNRYDECSDKYTIPK